MIMINDPVSLTFFLFSTLSFNTVLEVGTKEDWEMIKNLDDKILMDDPANIQFTSVRSACCFFNP